VTTIVVIGSTGRIGRAVLPLLEADGVDVRVASRDMVDRAMNNDLEDLADLATDATALLNLAGRAHLQRGSAELSDLMRANVELPLRLLEVATRAGTKLVHMSSTKAGTADSKANAYAQSKALAESLLREAAEREGSAAVVAFRTCAVMAPPYDAGKLSLLDKVHWAPGTMVPKRTVPVISPEALSVVLRQAVDDTATTPFTVFEVPRTSMMSLRDVVQRLHAQR
jgi:nucleoside-diphosphate-sugar epimerase